MIKKKELKKELITYLIVACIFLLAFYLGPTITGFTIVSHTSSSNWIGTYLQTNSSTLTTELILDNATPTTYFTAGNYTSQVLDGTKNTQWDNLSWNYLFMVALHSKDFFRKKSE